MPTGIYKRTEYHRKILENNSSFKKGVPRQKGLPSAFKGKHHTKKAKEAIGKKAFAMWKNPRIRKQLRLSLRNASLGRLGPAHQSFKGRVLNSNGYWYIYSPHHPMATASKYVLEHRLNVEKKIGRFLTKKESVHHVNENRQDNRPENLMAFVSRGIHKRFHDGKQIKPSDITFDGRNAK